MGTFYYEDYICYILDDTGSLWLRVRDNTKTSYANISEHITYEGKTYTVTSMSYCFYECESLVEAPEIPNSVTNMSQCFYLCTSLREAPIIPNSVTNMGSCFNNCDSLVEAPVIPNFVTNMERCFEGCDSLVEAPVIPNSVTNMNDCFIYCSSLVKAPVIPNSVTNMDSCFKGCTALTGYIIVNNTPTTYGGIFTNAATSSTLNICVVQNNNSQGITRWSEIADTYTNVQLGSLDQDTSFPHIINIDEYNYKIYKTNSQEQETVVSAKVRDEYKESESYITPSDILPALTINNTSYYVVNLEDCFKGCTFLREAPIIPNSVTNMTQCFYDCNSLVEVLVMPNSAADMFQCFYGCTSLRKAPIIPNSVTNMIGCFYKCTSLVEAPVIPNLVTDMSNCFGYCSSLVEAPVIPNLVTNLEYCFYKCTSLAEAPEIPNSVNYMGGCFYGCTSLVEAPEIPNWVTDMAWCFYGCTSLVEAPEIPNWVTDMAWCFYGCTSLREAPEIPNSVINMNDCFAGCTALTGYMVVNNTPTTYANIFTDAVTSSTLYIYVIQNNNPQGIIRWSEIADAYTNVQLGLLDQDTPLPFTVNIDEYNYNIYKTGSQEQETVVSVKVRDEYKESESYTAPSDILPAIIINNTSYYVVSLEECFKDCAALIRDTKVPSTVVNMDSCFEGCSALEEMYYHIQNSVESMDSCFKGCTSLDSFIVVNNAPTSADNIFDDAIDSSVRIFVLDNDNSEGLSIWTDIANNYSKVSIGSIYGGINLLIDGYLYSIGRSNTHVEVYESDEQSWLKEKKYYPDIISPLIFDGVEYPVTSLNDCFASCRNMIESPEIPNSVTDMGYCFYNCSSLVEVPEIPNSVTSMNNCFGYCTSLVEAPEIPNSVTNLEYCFRECAALKKVPVIPDSVTNMASCFYDCTSLVKAPVIPNSVISMLQCFKYCTSLVEAPVIPNSVAVISHCFYGCISLVEAPTISNSVTDMSFCFYNCMSLVKVPVIPNSVTILDYCFYGCTSLVKAPVIPNSVTDMDSCFQNCKKLQGGIAVYNNPVYYEDVFLRTDTGNRKNIYIYFIGNNQESIATWRDEIANEYSYVYFVLPDDETIPDYGSSFSIGEYEYSDFNANTTTSNYTAAIKVDSNYKEKSSYSNMTNTITVNGRTYKITDLSDCFSGCNSLVIAPKLSDYTANMDRCFKNCSALTNISEIPKTATSLTECFSGCTNLNCNITVYNNSFAQSQPSQDMFDGVDSNNNVFLINGEDKSTSAYKIAIYKWRDVIFAARANNKFANIHYEYDDNPAPSLTVKAFRVTQDGTKDSTGDYVYFIINGFISTDSNRGRPHGYITDAAFKELTIYKVITDSNGNKIEIKQDSYTGPTTPTSQVSHIVKLKIENDPQGQYPCDYKEQQIYRIVITNTYYNTDAEIGGKRDSKNIGILTQTILRAIPLLDFLGKAASTIETINRPGMGMSIGTFATRDGLDINYPVTIGEGLLPPIKEISADEKYVDLDNYQLTIGRYNEVDNDASLIVGNGTGDDDRHNAFKISRDGDLYVDGDVHVDGDIYRKEDTNFKTIFDIFYPVGSYYDTSDANFNPNEEWGGTWEKLEDGRVLIAGNSSYTTEGGSATSSYTPSGTIGNTTLTDAQIAHGHGFNSQTVPNHTHTVALSGGGGACTGGAVTDKAAFNTNNSGAVTNGITGGSHTHKLKDYNANGSAAVWVEHIANEKWNWTSDRCEASTHTHNLPNHTHSIPAHGHGFTQPKIPNHTHTISSSGTCTCTGGGVRDLSGAASTRTGHNHSFTGVGADINIMQPYTPVYRWHRTA